MIIWLLLLLAVLSSVAGVALTKVNEEATEAMRAVYRQRGIAGVSVGCIVATFALAMGVLWAAYAYSVGDWRFAALFWLPYSINMIGRLARNVKVRSVP